MLSNNVEELVITREKIDSNGTEDTPDVPTRSPTLCSEAQGEVCEESPSGYVKASTETDNHQFILPFSNQVILPRAFIHTENYSYCIKSM